MVSAGESLRNFIACGLLLITLFSSSGAFAPSLDIPRLSRATFQKKKDASRTRQHVAKNANMSEEEREIAMEKATKAMTSFTNTYLKNTKTRLCSDKSVPAVVIKGLAQHKVTLGSPLCPCRFYDDKEAEAKDGYWNCPCVPMRERHECHCMLFLTEENGFASEDTKISYDEVLDMSSGMSM